MAKKNFKKNNPALPFFTPSESLEKEESTEENRPPITQQVQDAYEERSTVPENTIEKGKLSSDTQNVHDTQEDAFTPRKETTSGPPTFTEAAPIVSGTQGRRGQKLPRINMAFSQENLAYLQWIARLEGCSMTEYVNRLLQADQEKRSDLLKKWKDLFDS